MSSWCRNGAIKEFDIGGDLIWKWVVVGVGVYNNPSVTFMFHLGLLAHILRHLLIKRCQTKTSNDLHCMATKKLIFR